MKRLKAYTASPYGFSESTRLFMEKEYIPELRKVVDVINPWGLTSDAEVKKARAEGKETEFNMEIGKRNREAIDACDIVVAALDGPQVDDGTAAEIGYAAGKGKTVFGYRSDFRQSGESGAVVNLQVQYFIESSGGKIVSTLSELREVLQEYSKSRPAKST